MSDINNYRGRNHKLLLYPEDSTHVSALDYIQNNFNYVAILHDKDKDTDGNIKKAHWHVLLCLPNDRFLSALSKTLDITPNYIRKCEDKNIFARYLLHLDDTDKYQYDKSELFGNIIDKFDFTRGGTGDSDKFINLLNEFEKEVEKKHFSYRKAIRIRYENNSLDTLRRYGALGTAVIKELILESS